MAERRRRFLPPSTISSRTPKKRKAGRRGSGANAGRLDRGAWSCEPNFYPLEVASANQAHVDSISNRNAMKKLAGNIFSEAQMIEQRVTSRAVEKPRGSEVSRGLGQSWLSLGQTHFKLASAEDRRYRFAPLM